MKVTFTIILISILISSCSTQDNSVKTTSKDCFTPQSFLKLKEFINTRIAYSGMGKFYVEYPPDPTRRNDRIKRPSNHPENVYDVRYDPVLDQITFKNEKAKLTFLSKEGMMHKKDQTHSDHTLANEIYCYLLDSANEN